MSPDSTVGACDDDDDYNDDNELNNRLPRTSTFIPNSETFQSPESVHFSRSDTLNASSSFEDEQQIPQDVSPPEQQMIEVTQNMLKRFIDA